MCLADLFCRLLITNINNSQQIMFLRPKFASSVSFFRCTEVGAINQIKKNPNISCLIPKVTAKGSEI